MAGNNVVKKCWKFRFKDSITALKAMSEISAFQDIFDRQVILPMRREEPVTFLNDIDLLLLLFRFLEDDGEFIGAWLVGTLNNNRSIGALWYKNDSLVVLDIDKGSKYIEKEYRVINLLSKLCDKTYKPGETPVEWVG